MISVLNLLWICPLSAAFGVLLVALCEAAGNDRRGGE